MIISVGLSSADGRSGNTRSHLVFFKILLGIVRAVKIATSCPDCFSAPAFYDKGLVSAIGGAAL